MRALTYFVEVAETRSFTQAAARLGVPASSVSRRVQDLETALGVMLFHRSTRAVNLTDIGQVYLEHVRPALTALSLAEEIVSDQSASPSGRIRITATPGYGGFKLVPALDKLRRSYPDLVVDVELTDRLLNLASAEVDIAIRATADPPDRAVARKLAENDYVLVAAPAYLAERGVPRKLADLSEHRTLLYRGPDSIVAWQAKTDTGWVELSTNPAFVTNMGRGLVKEAVTGAGLALLPYWGVAEPLDKGCLKVISLEDATLSISRRDEAGVYLLYHKPKFSLRKIRVAVEFLMAELTGGR